MAKQSGLGDYLFVDGFDLSGDVGSVSRLANPSALLEVPGLTVLGQERIYGLYDGALEFAAWFNDATDQEHEVLKAKGSGADRVIMYCHGAAIGNMAAGIVAKQVNYDWTRGTDGGLAAAVQCLGNGNGLDFGEQLTAGKQTDASAAASDGLDNGAASAGGLAAYLEVFSIGSGSPTVKLQESSDDGGIDLYADVTGGSFGVVTAETAERLVTTLTQAVEQYLKAVTTGTFTDLVFAVAVTRDPYQ